LLHAFGKSTPARFDQRSFEHKSGARLFEDARSPRLAGNHTPVQKDDPPKERVHFLNTASETVFGYEASAPKPKQPAEPGTMVL
jgi:hypothetical protein